MAGRPPWAGVHPVLRLVRIGNVLVSFAGALVGALAAAGRGVQLPPSDWAIFLVAAASAAFVTAGGNVLNDLRDRDSDRRNHPDRPLVTGAIAPASARNLCVALLTMSVVSISWVGLAAPWLWVILPGALAALLAYEFRFKARGLSGNLLVAALTAALFLYGGAAANAPWRLLPFVGMAFGATLSREVIKDMEDAEGDVDRRTLPRTHGLPLATTVARLAVAISIGLSPVPLLSLLVPLSGAGIMYLGLVLAADALFVVSVAMLPARLHRAQTISKGAMTVALLAFLATAFR